jgi:hypothetical protein
LRKFSPSHPDNLLQCEKHKLLMKSEHQKRMVKEKNQAARPLALINGPFDKGQQQVI